jgi:hypothetical protein
MSSPTWTPTSPPHNDSTRAGFHVPYVLGEGKYGKGLFATQRIPKGTLMWKYRAGALEDPSINVVGYTTEAQVRARLESLPTIEKKRFFVEHIFSFAGVMNEIVDDGAFWNHSEDPNTGLPPEGEEYCIQSTYAVKDIEAGQEFLDDYGLYDHPEWYHALLKEYGAPDTAEYVTYKELPKHFADAVATAAKADSGSSAAAAKPE